MVSTLPPMSHIVWSGAVQASGSSLSIRDSWREPARALVPVEWRRRATTAPLTGADVRHVLAIAREENGLSLRLSRARLVSLCHERGLTTGPRPARRPVYPVFTGGLDTLNAAEPKALLRAWRTERRRRSSARAVAPIRPGFRLGRLSHFRLPSSRLMKTLFAGRWQHAKVMHTRRWPDRCKQARRRWIKNRRDTPMFAARRPDRHGPDATASA